MIGDHGPYAATVHTADGRLVGDLSLSQVVSTTWSRESNEVSRATIVCTNAADIAEDITPWLHWITLWDRSIEPVWTGPVLKTVDDGQTLTVSARDTGTFLARTRTPASMTWAGQGPSVIAGDLWRLMLRLHGVQASPDVREMPGVDRFDYSTSTDATLLSQNMTDLVKIGLRWCVVAGRPVLGDIAPDPVAALAECDFLEATQVVRDGSRTANDVMVRGQNFAHTAVVDLGGLHLQALVSIDDLFGVANIQRAAAQYTRQSGVIREQVVVPSSVTLHPDAEVSLGDLVPGALMLVQARGVDQIMRLVKVEVSSSSGVHSVAVTLETIQTVTELGDVSGQEVAL